MPYIANTDADRAEMLKTVGCGSIEELWKKAGIEEPAPALDEIPPGLSEFEVVSYLFKLASRNATGLVNFLGCGYYDHIIPAAVFEITSRSEFYTAYTPYQPEASQGTLQAIYEYQSAICRLTGMPAANASMYDGGTALFEAMMLAVRATRRRKAVISGSVSPILREMIRCYSSNLKIELKEVSPGDFCSNQKELAAAIDDETACVLMQYPDAFGTIEDLSMLVEQTHSKNALAVCSAYPIALAVLKTPGEMGFDIVTGEGQSLGMPLNFGGPYLGFMAVQRQLLRKMPGRIAGKAFDASGREGFVLTLQAREQHIRRAGATSNICSNENLCALSALAYLSCVGKNGLVEVAELCAAKAAFAREELIKTGKVKAPEDQQFFNEFVVELPSDASEIAGKMIDKGFAAGFPLGRYYKDRKNQLLIAVTEKRTREEIKSFANAMEAVL
ncbi:MAG: aminomethyl-transferring glycine dehydrogenase subunit GcvPA [Victivallales bacterium]|nr:aminomethyl-transferring glycine dehydrogenase subunit GcvPA [Victivallales bacterium]